MHLWGKMAAQHHWHQKQQQHAAMHAGQHQPPSPQPNLFMQQQQQQHISGLAANLRPSYFTGVSAGVLSGKERVAASNVLGNVTNTHTHPSSPKQEVYTPLLAALLHGKHGAKTERELLSAGDVDREKKAVEAERKQQAMQQEQARAAVIAAVASQTMFKKLGQAFWDAFSGSSSSNNNSHSTSGRREDWDADKVRRVLEGKAVVRVVDVESVVPEVKPQRVKAQGGLKEGRNVSGGGSVSVPSSPLMRPAEKCGGLCDSLEERMRSLALGPRAGKD